MPLVPAQLPAATLSNKSTTSKILIIGFILCGLTEFLLIVSLIRDPSVPWPSILIILMAAGTAIIAHFLYVLVLYHQSPSRGPILATFFVTAIGTSGYCGVNTANRRWHFWPIAAVSCHVIFVCFAAWGILRAPTMEKVQETAPFTPHYESAPEIDLNWNWAENEIRQDVSPICYPTSDAELGNLPVYGSVPFPTAV
jgi:hypothetical protein